MASRVICFLSLNLLLLDIITRLQVSGQLQLSPKKVDAEIGQEVKLTCEVLRDTSQGCSWLFQNSSSELPQPTFIIYVSSSRSKLNDKLDPNLFSARKETNKYILTLSKFSTKNQGYYFCSITSNSVMYFSPLVPVFQKENSIITKPVTRAPTPVPPPTGTPRPLRPEACRPGASGSVEGMGLGFACNIYIWAPLAGICAVLLLSLVITLICCHRNRRRVCKCPRPLVKPRPSEKFV